MKHSKVWLTSFGDLLTLLLCFFAVAVYAGAKQHWAKVEQKQAVTRTDQSLSVGNDPAGKLVASKEMTEFLHPSLILDSNMFETSYAGLNSSGRQALEGFIAATEGQVELGICEVGFDYSVAALESVEDEIRNRPLQFSVGAKACEVFKALRKDEVKESVVLIANVKTNHG